MDRRSLIGAETAPERLKIWPSPSKPLTSTSPCVADRPMWPVASAEAAPALRAKTHTAPSRTFFILDIPSGVMILVPRGEAELRVGIVQCNTRIGDSRRFKVTVAFAPQCIQLL